MTNIVVVLVVLAIAVLAFFKIPLLQALATIVVALVSTFVAFGYHEIVGGQLADFVPSLAAWAQAISFMLLFVLVFAVLQTGVVTLLRSPVGLGQWPERIGRPICGLVLGWIVAGVLVTAVWLAPLGSDLPYVRYNSRRPEVGAPSHVLLNADGMVTGWFSMVSRGSLKALRHPTSFGIVRAGFLDQMALNRLQGKAPRITEKQDALTAYPKNGVREAPTNLVDTAGEAVTAPSGRQLMVVRLGIRKSALKGASPFTLAQVSVVCKNREAGAPSLSGQGIAVYPLGFLTDAGQLERPSLIKEIPIDQVKDDKQWIDFVFPIPNDMDPVLGRFKLNTAVTLSMVIDADEPIVPSGFSMKHPQREADNVPDASSETPSSNEPG